MDGRVVHIRNNYAAINFDFGPTLFGWLQRHGAHAYRAMRLGDWRASRSMADTATRSRSPTTIRFCRCCGARDEGLQIAWGIEDFVSRFRRRPDGMWLPECAADRDTLRDVARAGIKFIILAPEQGTFRGDDAQGAAAPARSNGGEDRLSLAVLSFRAAIFRARVSFDTA